MIEFWKDTDSKGITAKCEFEPINFNYIITVSYGNTVKTEKFRCSFEPRFGMDIIDSNQSMMIAEKLALEIEKELNL